MARREAAGADSMVYSVNTDMDASRMSKIDN